MGMTLGDMASALALAASSTVIAKVLVDLCKVGGLTVTWLYPVLALLFGIGASLALLIANSATMTPTLYATAAVAGVLSAGAAVGVTEVQRAGDARKDAMRAEGEGPANG